MGIGRSWTFQDVDHFFYLVRYTNANLVINPGGALSRLASDTDIKKIEAIIGDTSNLGTAAEERYATYLARVKSHSFGKWLFNNTDFKHAYRLFQKKHRASGNHSYRIEWAELRFLWCATIVGLYILHKDSGIKRQYPNSRQVTQAITLTKKLQNSLAVGIKLEDYFKTQQLHRLLGELLETLKSTKRKPRSDANSIGREFVATISKQLLEDFGKVSPEIVIHLAAVLGYRPHETAITKQIQAVRKKHRQAMNLALAAALMKGQKITA